MGEGVACEFEKAIVREVSHRFRVLARPQSGDEERRGRVGPSKRPHDVALVERPYGRPPRISSLVRSASKVSAIRRPRLGPCWSAFERGRGSTAAARSDGASPASESAPPASMMTEQTVKASSVAAIVRRSPARALMKTTSLRTTAISQRLGPEDSSRGDPTPRTRPPKLSAPGDRSERPTVVHRGITSESVIGLTPLSRAFFKCRRLSRAAPFRVKGARAHERPARPQSAPRRGPTPGRPGTRPPRGPGAGRRR